MISMALVPDDMAVGSAVGECECECEWPEKKIGIIEKADADCSDANQKNEGF